MTRRRSPPLVRSATGPWFSTCAGAYRVTAWPDLPDYAAVIGDGSDVTTIGYAGDGPLIALRGKHRVSFKRLGIYVTGATGAAVSLSECFRCSFDSVVLRGGHVSTNYPEFTQQRGVILDQNTGGTAFINCDVNNFGIGLTTRCIQNYVTSSKFTSNYVGVLGTGNDHSAGLSMVNVEFVSDTDPNTTDKHVLIDGAANDWWLTNVWFEGADIALSIGNRDRGGARAIRPGQLQGRSTLGVHGPGVLPAALPCQRPVRFGYPAAGNRSPRRFRGVSGRHRRQSALQHSFRHRSEIVP